MNEFTNALITVLATVGAATLAYAAYHGALALWARRVHLITWINGHLPAWAQRRTDIAVEDTPMYRYESDINGTTYRLTGKLTDTDEFNAPSQPATFFPQRDNTTTGVPYQYTYTVTPDGLIGNPNTVTATGYAPEFDIDPAEELEALAAADPEVREALELLGAEFDDPRREALREVLEARAAARSRRVADDH